MKSEFVMLDADKCSSTHITNELRFAIPMESQLFIVPGLLDFLCTDHGIGDCQGEGKNIFWDLRGKSKMFKET